MTEHTTSIVGAAHGRRFKVTCSCGWVNRYLASNMEIAEYAADAHILVRTETL